MELDKHQRYAVRLLSRHDGGAVWHRVGEGKTRITYAWFATIAKQLDVVPIFLVVCRRKGFYDWQQEAIKCGLDWRVVDFEIFLGKLNRPTVFLVSHGMLHRLAEGLREYAAVIQAVVFDEGFLYKTPQSLHTKSAHAIAQDVGPAAILSGSVMTNRNLEDIYGQFYAINKHQRAGLGRTLTEFRSAFMFKLHIDPHRPERIKFINAKRSVERVAKLVAPFASIWIPKSSRKIRHVPRYVDASAAQSRAMDRLRDEMFLETRKGVLELKNAPTLITKCQQISDGWLNLSEGQIRYGSEKLAYLMELISELISCGEQVLVWCAFQHSVDLILQQLQKELPSVKAYGFTGTRRFNIGGWQSNGQVAVATEDCGSTVNHFAQVRYAIYYSMSFKWLSLQQSMGRNDRKNSRHKVAYYYYLYTRGSLDKFVHDTAKRSGKAEKDFIDLGELNKWLTEPSHFDHVQTTRATSNSSRNGALRIKSRSMR